MEAFPAALMVSDPWLHNAITTVGEDPGTIAALFAAVGRQCGRAPIDAPPRQRGSIAASASERGADRARSGDRYSVDGWRTDDAARCQLLLALPHTGAKLADEVSALYHFGDADEKRAVLRGLAFLDLGAAAQALTRDALRSNDTRLVAAAMGPYARHLDDEAWRHGVLKCVFMGIKLSVVDGLADRADASLAAMLDGLTRERAAAGRVMPADALALLDRLTGGERAHL